MNRKPIFDEMRRIVGRGLTQSEVDAMDAAIDEAEGVIVVTAPEREFDKAAFLARYVNKNAPAITTADIEAAARRWPGVTTKHIRMVIAVESGGAGFDAEGRPAILFEPHIFHRRTNGRYSPADYSYAKWRERPYPKSRDARWQQMADAAEHDEQAALESASWGLFQIMGFHWQALGYSSVQAMTQAMAATEQAHLDAVLRFIETNNLVGALAKCRAGDPDSCRAFAKGYNGAGYATNRYHVKMAEALR